MFKRLVSKIVILFIVLFSRLMFSQSTEQDWTRFARISGNGLSYNNINDIMKKAKEQGVLGIELDNDITGRYDSFLDPTQKLEEIKKAAEVCSQNWEPCIRLYCRFGVYYRKLR